MHVYYLVEELSAVGLPRCRLFTSCPWHALAEWLIKAYRPAGMPPGVKPGDGKLEFETQSNNFPLEDQLLNLLGTFLCDGQPIRHLRIRTQVGHDVVDSHYTAGSAKLYRSQRYDASVRSLAARLERFSVGQFEIAYVLTQFSSVDTNHPFWHPGILENKDLSERQ